MPVGVSVFDWVFYYSWVCACVWVELCMCVMTSGMSGLFMLAVCGSAFTCVWAVYVNVYVEGGGVVLSQPVFRCVHLCNRSVFIWCVLVVMGMRISVHL